MTEPVIYTFAEVAAMTKGVVSKDWLERGARAGKFEHVHVGRNRGLTPAQLDALLASFSQKPATPAAAPEGLPAVEIKSASPRSRAYHGRKRSAA